MTNCPCLSGKSFDLCCEPYLNGTQAAPSAVALMRSRYTAYVLANVDYLEKTSHGLAAEKFNRASALKFAKESQWQGLDIVRNYQPFDYTAYVEFVAHYNDKQGRHQHLNELSEFQLIDGHWYYVDGQQETHHHDHGATTRPMLKVDAKVGRNDPCPCGSGKKFKKCCYNG